MFSIFNRSFFVLSSISVIMAAMSASYAYGQDIIIPPSDASTLFELARLIEMGGWPMVTLILGWFGSKIVSNLVGVIDKIVAAGIPVNIQIGVDEKSRALIRSITKREPNSDSGD